MTRAEFARLNARQREAGLRTFINPRNPRRARSVSSMPPLTARAAPVVLRVRRRSPDEGTPHFLHSDAAVGRSIFYLRRQARLD